MVAGLLRVLIKFAVAGAIVLLLLTMLGDYLRQLVPEQHHRAVWQAGLIIFFPCAVGFALLGRLLPVKRRRLENLLLVGASIGALLFSLFVTDVECKLIPGRRSGQNLDCHFVGES